MIRRSVCIPQRMGLLPCQTVADAVRIQLNGATRKMVSRLALIGNQAFSMLNFRGRLIQDIVARGHDVFAFAPDFDEASRNAVRALGATPMDHRLIRTGMNLIQDADGLAHLVGQLRSVRPDTVLSYSIKPVTYGTLASRIAGVPRRFAMIEGLGHVFMEDTSLKSRALRAGVSQLYRMALSLSDLTLFLNPDDRSDFLRLGLVKAEKTELIGGIGVDLDGFHPAPAVVKPMTFTFIGRLLREKGLGELVEAMRLVKARWPRSRLVLLGDIDSNPSSFRRDDVEAWVAEGLLEWPGQVEVEPWLRQASVFVLPSYREGVPRSTQEAMAMGRPVITTDVPGCRETVVEGLNGYLVPARDTAALAGAMMRFLERPELVAPMGAESRRIAEQRFDVAKVNARLIELMGL